MTIEVGRASSRRSRSLRGPGLTRIVHELLQFGDLTVADGEVTVGAGDVLTTRLAVGQVRGPSDVIAAAQTALGFRRVEDAGHALPFVDLQGRVVEEVTSLPGAGENASGELAGRLVDADSSSRPQHRHPPERRRSPLFRAPLTKG
ncbi:hypothetical protein ACIQOW_19630 [Kitasatospora sp. NPDC091335]|uniref:hypothetical protein n=1 Tax=Kitasatospora sp. NPDC091335 TaxID=3364085 RepID=UPI003819B304